MEKEQKLVAVVKKEIEDELDNRLPYSYDTEIYEEKCNVVFQHIYNSTAVIASVFMKQ